MALALKDIYQSFFLTPWRDSTLGAYLLTLHVEVSANLPSAISSCLLRPVVLGLLPKADSWNTYRLVSFSLNLPQNLQRPLIGKRYWVAVHGDPSSLWETKTT